MGFLTIGELARRTGLTTRTIRFYSDEGLLPPADRTHAGYRLYDGESLARLELLRTLRELGLGLPDASARTGGPVDRWPTSRAGTWSCWTSRSGCCGCGGPCCARSPGTESELDEVRLMKNLATMTDEERAALIDEFWDEVTAGLDINPDFDAGHALGEAGAAGRPDAPSSWRRGWSWRNWCRTRTSGPGSAR